MHKDCYDHGFVKAQDNFFPFGGTFPVDAIRVIGQSTYTGDGPGDHRKR